MKDLLDKLIKINLYLLVFLVPIFFLPLTIWPVALNKQMLLSFLALFCLVLWLIKIFSEGKVSIVWNKTVLLVLAMILVFGLSTIFSGARAQCLWGMNIEADSFFNLILFGLVFFLFANIRGLTSCRGQTSTDSADSADSILYAFLASAGVLSVLFLLQIFLRKPLFPWDFSQSMAFNPVGTIQALGLFLGAALTILMALISVNQPSSAKISGKTIFKRFQQLLPIILGILLFACIFIINYWLIWFGISLSLVIIMAEKSKTLGQSFSQKELKSFILPLTILCFALLAIFIRLPSSRIINLSPEVALTQKTSFDIAFKTLKESGKNLILGSGPATFGYQYSLYRPSAINLTDFWQVRFNQANNIFLTFLATSGILGFFVILLLIAVFFLQGLRMLMTADSNPMTTDEGISGNQPSSAVTSSPASATISRTQLAVFTAGFYLLVLWFFYPFNFVLGFAAFLFLGLFVAAQPLMAADSKLITADEGISGNQLSSAKISGVKEFSFTQSSQKAFFTMMLCVILIVGSGVCFYHLVQKYRAALIFSQGMISQELDGAITKINQAAVLDPKDDYFRNLSELFLIKTNEVVNNQDLEQEQKKELFQQAVSNAEMSAAAAVKINPKNSQNWLQLSSVYENLAVFGVEGAMDLAISNYEKTKQMDPQNPQIPLNMGRVYKTELERAKVKIAILEQAESKDEQEFEQTKIAYQQYFDLSIGYFKKSIELKPNFSAGYFLMAQNYETNGEKEKALENYKIVLQLEPGNEEIKAKIEELSH